MQQRLDDKGKVPNLFAKSRRLISQNNEIDGVISERDLHSQLELFCGSVKHPITLFSFYDFDEKGNMKRVNSAISTIALHYCCETFRICAGKKYCEQCDSDHASFFKGDTDPITANEMEKYVNDKIDRYMKDKYQHTIYCNKYNEDILRPEYVELGQNRGYLKYLCPMSGFEEHIFPVIVSDLILGVIFCGQIQRRENDDKAGRNIRVSFLEKRVEIFNSYFREFPQKKDEVIKILEDGIDLNKEPNPFPLHPDTKRELLLEHWIDNREQSKLTKEQYEALIVKIKEALKKLTDELEKSMKSIRKKYIARVVKNKISSFYPNVIDVSLSPEDKKGITKYWTHVKKSLDGIVKDLSLHSVQIYGATMPQSDSIENYNHLDLVVYSKWNSYQAENKETEPQNEFIFRLEKSDKKIKEPFLSLNDFEIGERIIHGDKSLDKRIQFLQGLVPDSLNNVQNILFYPVKENLLHSSALVIYNQKNRNDQNYLEDTSFINNAILMELYLLSTLIFYSSSYLLDFLLQSHTEMVLRFFRHELSHILLGYNFLNTQYIQRYDYYTSLKENERKDVQSNFTSTEEMLEAISTNIELITKPKEEIQLHEEQFKIFKELFFKWENLYRDEIKSKHLSFSTPTISADDPERPLINTDKRLLEQIVYNIVHNAIKYSNWGTKIRMDCKRLDNSGDTQVLSVTDYGAKIELGKNIYDLYYRSIDTKKVIEGSGIGLFVVRRITELLRFKVDHSCEPVSEYNVALIEPYIENKFKVCKKDPLKEDKLRTERERLKHLFPQIINTSSLPEEELSEKELVDMIEWPTYKVTFEVII